MDDIIDTCGLSCPQPMLMAKKGLEKIKSGTVTIIADTEASKENISRSAADLGWKKESEKEKKDIFTMVFSK